VTDKSPKRGKRTVKFNSKPSEPAERAATEQKEGYSSIAYVKQDILDRPMPSKFNPTQSLASSSFITDLPALDDGQKHLF